MADIDEIPYAATLDLLKTCEAPLPIHLQLQNYMYSFEFPTLADSWRAQLHRWSTIRDRGGYMHGQASDRILASSGWHCRYVLMAMGQENKSHATDPQLSPSTTASVSEHWPNSASRCYLPRILIGS